MDFSRLITTHQNQIEKISALQKLIFDVTEDNYEETVQSIMQSRDILIKDPFRHILATLGAAFHTRPKMTDIIMKLIVAFSEPAMKLFSAHELYSIFCADLSHCMLLKLIQNNVFNFETIFSIPHNEDEYFIKFFGPELVEHNKEIYEPMVGDLIKISFDEHRRLRDAGENESKIATLIRTNDASEFIEYVSKSNIPLDSKIPESIYEKCYFVQKEPSFFEYAAFCGAVDVFKYLMSSKTPPSSSLSNYAVAGGNLEIIHLCEKMKCSFEGGFDIAIWSHRDDIIDYLTSQGIGFTFKAAMYCILGYNYEYFYKALNDQVKNLIMPNGETSLIFTMKHMYSEFGIAISSMNEFDLNRTDLVLLFLF